MMIKTQIVRPSITFDELEPEIKDIVASGIYTNGNAVSTFTKQILKITQSKFCFPTTSATTALWTCLKILKITSGDEVLISDFSYPATANVVEDLGAKPVFVDVNLETFNMLPEDLLSKISSKTKAVIFVDALGNPSGLHDIKKICKKHNIILIEDAACAIGSSEKNKMCGSISDLTCFSFHPRKIICAGEGGAITTNSKNFARQLELKLTHGLKKDKNGNIDFIDYGYNFRMSEIQAALASIQLKKLDNIIEKRLDILNIYKENLIPLGFKNQKISNLVKFNVQSATFIVTKNISAKKMIKSLQEKHIDCSIGTYALSSIDYYKKKYKNPLKNSKFLMNNSITLPCYENLNVKKIIDVIYSIYSSL